MKKYLNLSWCLLLVLGFASCDTDDDVRDQPREIGGYATLSDRHISVFDTNEDLAIKFYTAEGVTVQSVDILQDGAVVGSATVSGETATFSSSILGASPFQFEDEDGVMHSTGSFPIRIRTTYSNGEVSEDGFRVSVDHAVELGDDNPTETNLDSLSTRVLEYSVSTHAAAVDGVTLMIKKNEAGTYADSGVTALPTDEGAVEISETNYETLGLTTGDTLYYKFTATSGSLMDSASSYVAVNNKEFAVSNEGMLSSDLSMNQYNLYTGEVSADGDEDGEIAYTDPTGFTVINGADLDFVKVADDYFETTGEGVVFAREAYNDAAAVKLTTVANVSNGNVFVYSTMRDVLDEDGEPTGDQEVVYGILKIGAVSTTTVDGVTVTSFDVENMEGN